MRLFRRCRSPSTTTSFRSETDIDGAFSVVNMVMRKERGHSQHGCDDNSDDHCAGDFFVLRRGGRG